MSKCLKNSKEVLNQCGYFTTKPYYLTWVLEEWEERLLEILRFLIEKNGNVPKWISNSLIMCESRFTKPAQITKAKKGLIDLDFIEVVKVNQKLGTLYRINYPAISSITGKLNAEKNSVRRMEIADEFRKGKGLQPLNESKIKKFSGTLFDNSWEEKPFVYVEQEKKQRPATVETLNEKTIEDKRVERDYLRELNELQADFSRQIISKWDLESNQEQIFQEAKSHGITIIKENNEYRYADKRS